MIQNCLECRFLQQKLNAVHFAVIRPFVGVWLSGEEVGNKWMKITRKNAKKNAFLVSLINLLYFSIQHHVQFRNLSAGKDIVRLNSGAFLEEEKYQKTYLRLSGDYAACGFEVFLQRKHEPLVYQVKRSKLLMVFCCCCKVIFLYYKFVWNKKTKKLYP